MKFKTARRWAAVVMILILLFSNLSGALYAEETVEEDTTEQTVGEETTDEEEGIMPCDIIYNQEIFAVLNRNVTVYCAPYEWGNASSGYTLSAGQGVFVIGREYECFYVYWYIGDREMYGYIPLSSVSVSNYYWIEYDIFRPGTCTATTPVLSYAGTTNTYFNIGEIYAGESPLMVLGQIRNQFNNRLYYFVQYQTAAGLAKRGWVDASSGTVSYIKTITDSRFRASNKYFCFINKATGKALTWNPQTNNVEQQTMTWSLYQFFKIEDVNTDGNLGYTGYNRILSAADSSKAMAVSSTGYTEGLSIVMQPKGEIDKRQEFRVQLAIVGMKDYCAAIYTRSSGEYRAVEVYGGAATEGANIIHSYYVGNTNQLWTVYCMDAPWGGTYGQYSGTTFPTNYMVHYDSSISNGLSLSDITNCISQWNNVYSRLSISAINKGSQYTSNRLATVENASFEANVDGTYVLGRCCPQRRYDTTIYTYEGTHLEDNWYSTVIKLDINRMLSLGYSKERIKSVFIHEMGHSLKLSHPFMKLENKDNTIDWNTFNYLSNIMNPSNTGEIFSPTNIDIWRLNQKWNSI